MKVAVVAPSPSPYTPGGAEAVWRGLDRALGERHEVELIKLPFPERTLPQVIEGYRAFSRLTLDQFDVVVSGKYPAWMVSHPHHVVYLLHPLRGLYDSYPLFGLPEEVDTREPVLQALVRAFKSIHSAGSLERAFSAWDDALAALGPDHPALAHPSPLGRVLVHRLDAHGMRPAAIRRYAAISHTVAARPDYFPAGVRPTVVYPPSDLQGLHHEPGEFFFTASRHDGPKRLDLLIEGMRHYPGSRPLLIAGSGPETQRLQALAAPDPRIRFVGRLSPDKLADHYARAIGVPFLPHEEDLGLITLEALASGKPVLTCPDSGGPLELVTEGVTGVVVPPDPPSVGAGLQRLQHLAGRADTCRAAQRAVAGITWQAVAEALVPVPTTTHQRRGSRPRVVVLNTFHIWPPRGGGQLRAYHLYGELAKHADVDVLALVAPHEGGPARTLGPGFREVLVPRSPEHQAAEDTITTTVGIPVTDIVAAELVHLTPAYQRTLEELLRGADCLLLAHPFLSSAARASGFAGPVVYDAHNCEATLKDAMLPRTAAGDRLRRLTVETEREACALADLIAVVSDQDGADLVRRYGVDPETLLLVANGVDTADIPYVDSATRKRRRTAWVKAFRAASPSSEVRHLAVFLGSWHQPNIEAAVEILRMAPQAPEIGFLLAGSHCEAIRDHPIPPNVMPLGVVSDTTKKTLLGSCDVALAPLLSGSGTNLKVVEYLAAGAPVVTTKVGARGLPPVEGIWHEAPCSGFVPEIRRVLEAPPDEESLARGRLLVETDFDWRALAERLLGGLGRSLW